MISIVEITNPPLGTGYQITNPSATYITDSTGIIVEPLEYYIVQSPDPNPPSWYVEEIPEEPMPEPVFVPQQVTMRQARLALLDSGLLSTIEDSINNLSEPQRTRSMIEWNHGSVVERQSQLVQQMSQALGLTPQQVDNLFILANTY